MSYITPNTTVRLLSGVNLDPSYINSIAFDILADQISYFTSKTKYVLTNQTYQRHSRGKMYVQKKDDDLYDCSYMMFQNTAYGNKWFYAFITNVEYVSDEVSVVTYSIDELQTWLFDVDVMPSIIERTHIPSVDDVVGASLTPEPFTMGEYIFDNQHEVQNFSDYSIVIQYAHADSAADCGIIYENNWSGVRLWVHHLSTAQADADAIRQFISDHKLNPTELTGMYIIPTAFYDPSQVTAQGFLADAAKAHFYNGIVCDSIDGTEDFDGYVPKNKKLYTFPYNYCEVMTGSGKCMPLRYEFSRNLTPRVNMDTNLQAPPSVVIRPTNYKGLESDGSLAAYPDVFGMTLTIDEFPLSSWVNDSYSTWWARNATPMIVSAMATAAGVMMPALAPEFSYALTPAGETVQKKLTQMKLDPTKSRNQERWFDQTWENADDVYDNALNAVPNAVEFASAWYNARIAPDNYMGSSNNGNNMTANRKTNLYARRAHITAEQAEIIDDYFTKYGYSYGRFGAVNRKVRSEFTYIKTKGCVVTGHCPAATLSIIQGLYDRGITWWVHGDNIGKYFLPNT